MCTCVVDGADGVHVVVHVGGVGAALAAVGARKLGARALQPNAQPVPGFEKFAEIVSSSVSQNFVLQIDVTFVAFRSVDLFIRCPAGSMMSHR